MGVPWGAGKRVRGRRRTRRSGDNGPVRAASPVPDVASGGTLRSLRRELAVHALVVLAVARRQAGLLGGAQRLAGHLEELLLFLAQMVVHAFGQLACLVEPGRARRVELLQFF